MIRFNSNIKMVKHHTSLKHNNIFYELAISNAFIEEAQVSSDKCASVHPISYLFLKIEPKTRNRNVK